jgi:anti-sigma factor RsiW
MAVNDNDMELLHEYVDGELPVADCEGLWRRLAVERDLMGELEHLRAGQDHARHPARGFYVVGWKYSADRGFRGGTDPFWV